MLVNSRSLAFGAAVLLALVFIGARNYLLFHTLAELISVVVAFGIFVIAWNSRRFATNGYLIFVGIAALSIGAIDLVHTLAYKGMGVFPGFDANLPTQLWIGARFLEAVSLLIAPFWLRRRMQWGVVLAVYAGITAVLLLSVFLWKVFPACYIEGSGLTPFKRGMEYVICVILGLAAVHLIRERKQFEDGVLGLLIWALIATIGAELAFTTYVSVYGPSNLIGHLLKVVAFFLLYLAIIETSFNRPYSLLLRDLRRNEEALRDSNDELQAQSEELQAQSDELQAQSDELLTQSEELQAANDALRESEQRYRGLVEVSPDAVLISNHERITFVNRAAVALFGAAGAEELIGRSPYDLFHPEHHPIVRERVRALMAGEHLPLVEEQIVRLDGSARDVEAAACPFIDRGSPAIQVIFRDVTERKRAEERTAALQAVTAALSAARTPSDVGLVMTTEAARAMGAVGGGLLVIAEEGRELESMAATGYPPETQAAWRRVSLDLPAPVTDAVRTGQPVVLHSAEEWDTRYPAAASDNRRLGYGASASIPLMLGGQVLGVMGLSFAGPHEFPEEDMALLKAIAGQTAQALERARLYESEQRASAEAQEANRAKDQFVALVSHELRNPLSAIQSGVGLLRHTMTPDARSSRALEVIDRNARLQTRLVNDLLDLSRLQREKLQFQRAPVELARVAAAAADTAAGEVCEAGLTLTCAAEPGLWVYGDFDRLQQVIANILSNAIKFTPAGGAIRLAVKRQESCVHLSVQDTGIGIDRNQLEGLFEVFHQGDVAAQRKPGLGLGLALVRGIVERHGGRVWAESEGPGTGSRFVVELPLITPPREQNAPAPPSSAGERPIGVLLVEDNPDSLRLMADALTLAGYVVHAAGSGEEALESLRDGHRATDGETDNASAGGFAFPGRPDVILCDVGLPGMDGFEFLRRARELPGLSGVPAFAVTGRGAEDDVRRGREVGFVGHFVKPVDLQALDRHIREFLAPR